MMKNTEKESTQRCSFCKVEEGELLAQGQSGIQLRTVEVFGIEKLACRRCQHEHELIHESREHEKRRASDNTEKNESGRISSWFAYACILVLTCSAEVFAQPALPEDPSQSPIDGGLSLVAIAGGMYAIKKLRNKKNE